MRLSELEAFQDVPFLFWIKDEEWHYLWSNKAICDLAGEHVEGKKDSELVWKANAEALVKTTGRYLPQGSRTTSMSVSTIPSTERRP